MTKPTLETQRRLLRCIVTDRIVTSTLRIGARKTATIGAELSYLHPARKFK